MEGEETSELFVELCFFLPFIPARASERKPTYQLKCPWLSPKLFFEQDVDNRPLPFGLLFLLTLKTLPSEIPKFPAAKTLGNNISTLFGIYVQVLYLARDGAT